MLIKPHDFPGDEKLAARIINALQPIYQNNWHLSVMVVARGFFMTNFYELYVPSEEVKP